MTSSKEPATLSIQNMLAVAPGGVLVFRADGNMSIVASNDRLWRLFGCDSEEEFLEYCGGNIWNLVAAADRERIKLLLLKSLELEVQKNHRYFYRIVAKDGMERAVEDCGGLIYSEGGAALVVCHFRKTEKDVSVYTSDDTTLVYDSTLEEKIQLETYIVEHFDEAMAQGYIKPYYQPIMRTLTDAVCGTEALARWIDPALGYISPADFIPVLERHHLITKLDLFILEQICINLKRVEKYANSVQPTSLNLSRWDFADRDMLAAVEEIVSRYGIAREMIHIEITESMVMEEPERLKREIARFQQGGYQVWLDDFGSGYAPLNALKEYPFDEMKIDMLFFRSFDEKSKEMLRATIRMAKRLGIQTLAEGVETKEQYAFLQEIGCEKAQGYYFSKPLPGQEIVHFAQQKKLNLEKRGDRHYYDQIGRVNRDTDRSLAIVEYDQKDFHILYRNQEFIRIGAALGMEQGEVLEYMMNSPASTLSRKFRYMQEKTKLGDEFVEMDFSVQGQYFRLRSRRISENYPRVANQVEIYNFTSYEAESKSRKLDEIFRKMYSLYDIIFLIHEDGLFENLMRSSLSEVQDKEKLKAEGVIVSVDVIKEYIHPEDRTEFLEFVDNHGLRKRLRNHERGFETRYFRSKLGRNGYTWKAHTMQYIPESDMVLYFTKIAPLRQEGLAKKLGFWSDAHTSDFDDSLLDCLKYSETINFFWKDRQRRFLGGSKKFYRTFGIEDESYILGKRDEDFHFVLDDGKSLEDEIQLLEHGTVVHEKIEKCIIQGVTHTILTSKEPIYRGDKIVGLLCGFVDVDELLQKEKGFSALHHRDIATGLLSAQGMIDSVYGYIESWSNHQEKFAIIRIRFLEQKRNYEEYGSTISNQIAHGVAAILRNFGNADAIVARLYAGNYALLKKYKEVNEVENFVENLTATLKGVHELAGYDLTLYPEVEVYYADQVSDTRDLIAVATGGTDVDLKVRKQLEDKLDYYDIQLETIIDSIPGGITIMEVGDDGEPHLVYASKGVGEISGRTTEEFLEQFEQRREEGIAPQDFAQVKQAMRDAVVGHRNLNISYRVNHVDGSLIWINMQGRVIGEQNGHPLFLAVYRNLSESTSIYEIILNESQEYVLVNAKADGEILYANKAAVHASHQVTGGDIHSFYELVLGKCTPDKRSEGLDQLSPGETRYEIVIDGRNLLVYYVDGVWNGRESTICYVFDITAKYTEERAKAARESLLYFESINSTYDMIVTYNLTKNYYNVYSSHDEFLGMKWSGFATYDELIDSIIATIPDDGAFDASQIYSKNQLKNYLAGNSYALFEHRAIDTDGNMHWLSDRVVYAKDPESGDVLAISLTMIIDDEVRERNEQQNILREALEEANSANKAKSQFLSNMSHDIRTPMNAIMGYASIAKDHMTDLDRLEDCINKILFSGKHLQDLINDVLDMSRIESGKDVIDCKPTVFTQMAEDVLAIIDPMAKEKHITVVSDLDDVVHMGVLADMTKIRRVMVNILSNAVKFTGTNGKIWCTLSETEIPRPGYGRYTFRVRDNGVGMSPEFLEHIYDLFTREKTSTVSQQVGSGLGMAIAKKYVDLMGGTISVESTQGVGTEVVVVLELEWTEACTSDAPQELEQMKQQLDGKHVLVVDDNKLNREIACILLHELGMHTDIALDGKMAVEKLFGCVDDTYDFVLMDMQMPVMNGVEATKIIRASDRSYLQTVPIIALTANAFIEDIKTCMSVGMNAHIAKPFSEEDFVAAMAPLLKN